jgi:hypothetical protein
MLQVRAADDLVRSREVLGRRYGSGDHAEPQGGRTERGDRHSSAPAVQGLHDRGPLLVPLGWHIMNR